MDPSSISTHWSLLVIAPRTAYHLDSLSTSNETAARFTLAQFQACYRPTSSPPMAFDEVAMPLQSNGEHVETVMEQQCRQTRLTVGVNNKTSTRLWPIPNLSHACGSEAAARARATVRLEGGHRDCSAAGNTRHNRQAATPVQRVGRPMGTPARGGKIPDGRMGPGAGQHWDVGRSQCNLIVIACSARLFKKRCGVTVSARGVALALRHPFDGLRGGGGHEEVRGIRTLAGAIRPSCLDSPAARGIAAG